MVITGDVGETPRMYVPVTTISSSGDSVSLARTLCFLVSERIVLCALEDGDSSPFGGDWSWLADAVAELSALLIRTSAAFALRGPSTGVLNTVIRSKTLRIEPRWCSLIVPMKCLHIFFPSCACLFLLRMAATASWAVNRMLATQTILLGLGIPL